MAASGSPGSGRLVPAPAPTRVTGPGKFAPGPGQVCPEAAVRPLTSLGPRLASSAISSRARRRDFPLTSPDLDSRIRVEYPKLASVDLGWVDSGTGCGTCLRMHSFNWCSPSTRHPCPATSPLQDGRTRTPPPLFKWGSLRVGQALVSTFNLKVRFGLRTFLSFTSH